MGEGDFPFYWVQLADFMAENNEPMDSAGPNFEKLKP